MTSCKKIIGVFVVFVCLMSFGFIGADADAAGADFGTKTITYDGFTDNDDGELTAYISNSDANDVVVKLVVKDLDGNQKASTEATIAANAVNQEVSVSFGYDSDGTKYVKVYLYDANGTEISVSGPHDIVVEYSIWKDWVTYLVVVIIVIAIIIIAYFYIRGAPDRAAKKAATLEGTSKSAPAERTKYDAGSERKSKRK